MKVVKIYSSTYTVISNEIYKHKLSLRAIGLYAYIINKPENWDFSIAGTATQVDEGKHSIRAAVNELEEKGFLRRSQVRNSDGLFSDYLWEITDHSFNSPSSVKPTSVKRTQVTNKKVNTKKVSSVVKTSKNSLTPCSEEELKNIATDLKIPLSSVVSKHSEMIEEIEDGNFQDKKYGKTTYFTLRKWLRMAINSGKLSQVKTMEEKIIEAGYEF